MHIWWVSRSQPAVEAKLWLKFKAIGYSSVGAGQTVRGALPPSAPRERQASASAFVVSPANKQWHCLSKLAVSAAVQPTFEPVTGTGSGPSDLHLGLQGGSVSEPRVGPSHATLPGLSGDGTVV
jgi:hypothetical protein